MHRYIHSGSQQYFAFNIWSIESAKAVMDAASWTGHNIILQTSMKVFEQLDKEELNEFVKSYAKKKKIKAYLHLDHCRKIELIHTAVACGWDSVMIDASDQPLDENIRITNEVTMIVRKKDVLVEAEIGQICGQEEASSIESGLAKIEDIKKFVKNTKVDMLAAAIGTVHGIYRGVPNIRYDRISAIGKITDIPMVVHGGTGLCDELLRKVLSYNNVKKINISTDVKLAYKHGIEESIQKGVFQAKAFDPLKVSNFIHDSIQNMAADKLKLLKQADASREDS